MRSGRVKTCPSNGMGQQIIDSKTESLVLLTLVYPYPPCPWAPPCSLTRHLHTPDYCNVICIDAIILCCTTINNVSMSDHITSCISDHV